MTDVLVRFEDGTTELRPANSPALASYAPTDCHPCDFRRAEVVPARPEPVVFWHRPGQHQSTRALSACRENDALVWCITGQDTITKALTGEWRRCYVEAWWEQIARLTRERDEAHAALGLVHKALAVTPGETALGAARRVASSLDACRWERDAIARRLAALRTWAEGETARWRDGANNGPPRIDDESASRWASYADIYEQIVVRIDGKE